MQRVQLIHWQPAIGGLKVETADRARDLPRLRPHPTMPLRRGRPMARSATRTDLHAMTHEG